MSHYLFNFISMRLMWKNDKRRISFSFQASQTSAASDRIRGVGGGDRRISPRVLVQGRELMNQKIEIGLEMIHISEEVIDIQIVVNNHLSYFLA